MRDSQKEIFGVAAILGFSADSLEELNRLYPNWRADLREILEELSTAGDVDHELRVLAVEALQVYAEWEAVR